MPAVTSTNRGTGVFNNRKKENPGGGNAGSDSYCYRSLRFQVCGLAVEHYPVGDELRFLLFFPAVIIFFYFFLILLIVLI
jgi:hypothetical protein